MRSRGFISLSMTLALAALFFVLQMLMMRQAETARLAVLRDRNRIAARSLARNGIEYARHQITARRWRLESRVWKSPSLQGHGRFEVTLEPQGRVVRVRSTGIVEDASTPERFTEEVRLP